MFTFYADKNRLILQTRELVTSGSVNVYPARFTFSTDWNGLDKVAVFRAGSGKPKEAPWKKEGLCEIPWEVLVEPRAQLYAGVYGYQGDEIVLPTQWVYLGTVLQGSSLGAEAGRPPSHELWKRELEKRGDGLEYDGESLSLMSGDKPLSTVKILGGGGTGTIYQFGCGLKVTGNTVLVDTVDDFSGDNTLPMTAAGVQATVGNIEALLGTI